MKKNGFTLIELLILTLIAAMIYVLYLRVTKPQWVVEIDTSYPYIGISIFTALFGFIAIGKIEKRQHGYAAFILVFMAACLVFKLSALFQ
jgi:predicted membrane channel-forming protein YqfA (hemolysin III family)